MVDKFNNTYLNSDNIVYKFPGDSTPTLSEVGGKGLSLIKGIQSGLPVPSGFILTVAFFTPWLDYLKCKNNWADVPEYSEEQLIIFCNSLKKQVLKLKFTSEQKKYLYNSLNRYTDKDIFAVRSSSPEEDLEGSSFAGGYETILGVRVDNIESAVMEVFISCLDHRVFIYKRKNHFDVTQPKIAVVIQLQINSEISGVGFSINPISNSFDEVVINSNWGLGETVVSGSVTPDTYVVDKISKEINRLEIGEKKISIWVDQKGGTLEKHNYRSDERTLSDNQILKLVEMIKKVEILYCKPMDTEWAFSNDNLYLLQARPITAYTPISPEMLTEMGKRKILYQDMTISVQGLDKPISVMGTSIYSQLTNTICKMLFSKELKLDSKKTLLWISNGKFYLNLSVMLGFVSKKKISSFMKNMDSLASLTFNNIEEDTYKLISISPGKYKLTIVRIILKVLPYVLRAIIFPKYVHKLNQRKMKEFEEEAHRLFKDDNLSLNEFSEKLLNLVSVLVFKYSAPIALSARIIFKKFKSRIGLITDAESMLLDLALPNNVTTAMNLEMFKLAMMIPDELSSSEFYNKFKNNNLSIELKTAWCNFLKKYGHRCPEELDPATPRYRDNPESLIKLLYSMISKDKDSMSQIYRFEQQKEKREQTYNLIYKRIKQNKGFVKAKLFKLFYNYFVTFAGYRETHKFYIILVMDLLRRRIIKEAELLKISGRLESIQQAFDLNMKELELAIENSNMNLTDIAEKNTSFIKKLKSCPTIPTIFDSRGTILKPPIPCVKDGETVGTPVSSGKASGPVKVMHTPTEKTFNKGDILIARATDPAWTPLFINAAAVILEVGGMLQHGALVAREYGLPCIVGVEGAVEKWQDGEQVEVDADAGIIRVFK